MTIALQVTFGGGLEASEALQRRVEREAEKLERFHDHIIGCRVAIIGRAGRRRHGELYAVRLQISTPGAGEIVIDRNPPADHAHEDAFVAVRDAFNAARRRLQNHHRRAQGLVKRHEASPHGKVSRLSAADDHGFIETSDGREIYFHRNAVVNGGFDRLKPGAAVRFAESDGEKGPQASTVHPLGRNHRLPG